MLEPELKWMVPVAVRCIYLERTHIGIFFNICVCIAKLQHPIVAEHNKIIDGQTDKVKFRADVQWLWICISEQVRDDTRIQENCEN